MYINNNNNKGKKNTDTVMNNYLSHVDATNGINLRMK